MTRAELKEKRKKRPCLSGVSEKCVGSFLTTKDWRVCQPCTSIIRGHGVGANIQERNVSANNEDLTGNYRAPKISGAP